MDRDWLARKLADGASYERVAREAGCSPSKVAYWAAKHGLASAHSDRHRARGGLTREALEAFISAGLSTRQIAEATGFGTSTVRFWIARHGLQTKAATRRKLQAELVQRPQALTLECPKHGLTRHFRRESGYRCGRCSAEHVSARRRRVKEILVAEAGGACIRCGYDRCARALEFHHMDPQQKRFHLANRGLSLSIDRLRAEAAKCVLLCSNCHAEVEDGLVDIPE